MSEIEREKKKKRKEIKELYTIKTWTEDEAQSRSKHVQRRSPAGGSPRLTVMGGESVEPDI